MPNRQQPLHHPIQNESPGPNHDRRGLLHSLRPAPRIRASRRPQREEARCARAVGDRHLHRLRCLLVRPGRCRPAIKSSATGGQTVKDYDKLDLSKNVMLIGLDIVRGRSRGVQKRGSSADKPSHRGRPNIDIWSAVAKSHRGLSNS